MAVCTSCGRREEILRLIVLFLTLITVLNVVNAFNIDIIVPIVKNGKKDSYFGYSVAQHQVGHETTAVGEPVILVGAPRDNVTDSRAPVSVQKLVRPGAVYQCPFTSLHDDCTAIKVDREATTEHDDRNEQWLGVSVTSQGTEEGKALVCSHRYKKVGPSFRHGLGLCISMTNALDEEHYYEPCNAKPRGRGHNEYGFCQAGISAAVDKEGELLLGAPGPINWRGAIFLNSIVPTLEKESKWYQSPVDDVILGKTDPPPAISELYSYLGWSVKIGHVIGGRKTYVAGAPRAKEIGQVLLFQKGPLGEWLLAQPEHYIQGDQFGSLFGYDIAIADFNIDGKEDLAVGAPFYHAAGIGGAIYIYMNGPEGITRFTKPLKITSRKMKEAECAQLDCNNARFGFSLSSIGDVNRDGFEDLAVGAPYEGNGAVYIYHGSASGLQKEYSQRIAASDFHTMPPRSFGTSIIGGMDMDQNGYPDIVVGSYASAQIHVLRSRPVINLFTVFEAIPPMINPKITQCPKNGVKQICFDLRICVRFTAIPKERFSERIQIQYTIESEKFTGAKISRIQFNRTANNTDRSTLTRNLRLNEQTSPDYKCDEEMVYIAPNTRDFLNPILLQLTYKLRDTSQPIMNQGDPLPDLNQYPILNNAHAIVPLKVDFIKDCGDDALCESDLKLTTRMLLGKDVEGDYVLRVGQDIEVSLLINAQNMGEDAHEATVTVLLPETMGLHGTDSDGKKYSCTAIDEPSLHAVQCFIGNPLQPKETATFRIRLDVSRAAPSSDKLNMTVFLNTTSIELHPEDNSAFMEFKVIVETDLLIRGVSMPETVYYSGEVKGESGIVYEDEIGTEVKHSYEIKNIGKASVPRSTVYMSWPYELQSKHSSGKHLLYLMEEPQLEGVAVCTFDRALINSRNIKPRPYRPPGSNLSDWEIAASNGSFSRSRRAARSNDPLRSLELKIGGGGTVILDCDKKTARCFEIICVLGELLPSKSIVITIRSRLWNATFVEEYKDVDEVLIQSKAEVRIDPTLNILQPNDKNDISRAVTKAYPSLDVKEGEGVPYWVIIVGVIAGVILLILLVILLWKCGFFRRHKHDEMAHHKAQLTSPKYDEYHD